MKRPKDMSREELDALPAGPMRCREEFDPETGITRVIPIMEKGGVARIEKDDIAFYRDGSGSVWSFGQFPDGSWYRRVSGVCLDG